MALAVRGPFRAARPGARHAPLARGRGPAVHLPAHARRRRRRPLRPAGATRLVARGARRVVARPARAPLGAAGAAGPPASGDGGGEAGGAAVRLAAVAPLASV